MKEFSNVSQSQGNQRFGRTLWSRHHSNKKVLVDFVHNPHAMSALFDMARAVPAKRRIFTFGQAGDRPDGLIQDMTRAAWAIGLERIQITELPMFYRGRAPLEVYQVIRDELIASPGDIIYYQGEIEALEDAINWAESGDLLSCWHFASEHQSRKC